MAKNHSNLNWRKKRNLQDFYKINLSTECWEWIKTLDGGGYANIWDQEKQQTVKGSRYFYEKLIGKIPQGLHLDHLCRNRKCVNPKHLEPVTLTENIRRGNRVLISFKKAEKIRQLYSEKKFIQIELAKMFGIGQDEISRIVNNRRWI